MKVALVLSGNLIKAPYILFYTQFLDRLGIEYDIISWNRLGIDEKNIIQFNCNAGESAGYFGRLRAYLGYRKFVINQLKKIQYDKVFVYTIALSILLYSFLFNNFNNRFVFDIRDYSILASLRKSIFRKLISASNFTVISSPGYLKWLPDNNKYYIAHNFPFTIMNNVGLLNENSKFDSKNINYTVITIGTLRDFDANRRVIDGFSNSTKFRLKFIGSGSEEKKLINYVETKSINNVMFYGLYNKKDELDLIKDAGLINNVTNNDINSKTLMTNRFYLSVVLGIPMIVKNNTYQGFLCEKYNLGCIVNFDNSLSNQVVNYLDSYDSFKYEKGRNEFITEVLRDMQNLKEAIEVFLKH